MKDTERNDTPIHPAVYHILRTLGILILLAIVLFSATSAVTFCLGLFADGNHVVQLPWQDSPIVSIQEIATVQESEPIDPSEVVEIARADFAVAGDIILHMPIVRTNQTSDGYNFDQAFSHVKRYINDADYGVVNLETTLSGTDGGNEYTGAPNFNSPDAIALSAKQAGFDMMLTGNEHCYDYGTAGLKRTLSVLKGYSLATLGTLESKEDSRYLIQSIGGVKVGMVCYTAANIDDSGSTIKLNNLTTDSAAAGLINAFDYSKLSQFYTELEGQISTMHTSGADAIVAFIHWGDEYNLNLTDHQKSIAQKLCDLGVDVIVGSHPHVVQPIDLLTSSVDSEHKTVCLYSTGNFLSNLRVDTTPMATNHCEDSVVFNFTLNKYSDGTVRVSAVSLLPTWVMVDGTGAGRDFYILPLDQSITDWKSTYTLTDQQLSDAKGSYNRTMAIVTPGLNKIATYLSEESALLDPSLGVG